MTILKRRCCNDNSFFYCLGDCRNDDRLKSETACMCPNCWVKEGNPSPKCVARTSGGKVKPEPAAPRFGKLIGDFECQ